MNVAPTFSTSGRQQVRSHTAAQALLPLVHTLTMLISGGAEFTDGIETVIFLYCRDLDRRACLGLSRESHASSRW